MRYFRWEKELVSDILWVIVSGIFHLILTGPGTFKLNFFDIFINSMTFRTFRISDKKVLKFTLLVNWFSDVFSEVESLH